MVLVNFLELSLSCLAESRADPWTDGPGQGDGKYSFPGPGSPWHPWSEQCIHVWGQSHANYMNCRRAGVRRLPQRKLGCGFQGARDGCWAGNNSFQLWQLGLAQQKDSFEHPWRNAAKRSLYIFFQRSLACSKTHTCKHVVGPFFDDAETQWILPGLGVSSECWNILLTIHRGCLLLDK